MNQYLATGAQDMQEQDGSMPVGVVRCQSDRCSGQQRSDTEKRKAELATVQLAQSRVNNSAKASVTAQRLATVRTQTTDASYLTQLVQYFGCFSVADVAVATTTDGEGCSTNALVDNSLAGSTATQMQHQSCTVVGEQYGQTSAA